MKKNKMIIIYQEIQDFIKGKPIKISEFGEKKILKPSKVVGLENQSKNKIYGIKIREDEELKYYLTHRGELIFVVESNLVTDMKNFLCAEVIRLDEEIQISNNRVIISKNQFLTDIKELALKSEKKARRKLSAIEEFLIHIKEREQQEI